MPIVFGDYEPIRKSYLIENFLNDVRNQNVAKSVHIDVGYDKTDPAGETRWLQSVADQHGYPHGIVGYADLGLTNVQSVLEAHSQFRNIRGIRHTLNYHPDPVKTYLDRATVMTESEWRAGFALLRRFNFSFDLQIYYQQMDDAYFRPFVLHAIDTFGTDRCMFASNFPVDKLFSSYDDLFNAFKAITKDFSGEERRAMFHDNTARFYRI